MTANDKPEGETAPRSKRRTPNVRWMALGALLIVGGITLGESLVVTHIVEKSEVLSKAYHSQDAKIAKGGELTDEEKADLRGALLGDTGLLGGLAAMLVLLPFCAGVLVGKLTGSARDAAITVAVGMAVGFAYEGTGVIAIIAGAVIYLGLGALAGLLGRRFAGRRQAAPENP